MYTRILLMRPLRHFYWLNENFMVWKIMSHLPSEGHIKNEKGCNKIQHSLLLRQTTPGAHDLNCISRCCSIWLRLHVIYFVGLTRTRLGITLESIKL